MKNTRQTRYADRMEEQGYERTQVWLRPGPTKEAFLRLAAALRARPLYEDQDLERLNKLIHDIEGG